MGGIMFCRKLRYAGGRLEWFKPRLFYFFSFPFSSFFFLPPFPSWGLLALLSSQDMGFDNSLAFKEREKKMFVRTCK